MTARLQILFAAVLFSTAGTAIKMTALTGWQVAAFRSGVAALLMILLLPRARRHWTWRTFLVGISYALTLTLFALANKLTTSASAIFLQSTAPLYLLFLAPLLLKEPLKKTDFLWMGLFACGLALVLQAPTRASGIATNPALGNALALASAVFYALMLCGIRWLGRSAEGAGITAAAAGNAIVFVACLPMVFAEGPIRSSYRDWEIIAWLGIFQIGIAYFLLAKGMSHVPAFETSLLMLLEPALSPIWSLLIHGEKPVLSVLGGGAIILGSTLAVLLSGREPATTRRPSILDSTPQ